ncbi:ABC transporter permease [Corynebacterium uterequi]|uniref:ABC-2 family transporter protein n=1 Tax=Corynebacterium uterequi TaxID=1072256 RepID=A0A0G3HF30_9CORY|nr:ABC transporter permease [Corynebacterium uterequi]AKK11909.1 ABC-2 family transporter protein [Corynebacterium uterequi]
MFVHVLHAEWTKLRTTASFWWIMVSYMVCCLFGMIVRIRAMSHSHSFRGDHPGLEEFVLINASDAIAAVPVFLAVFLYLAAAHMVTNEYRHNLPRLTYLATPKRWMVAAAKAVLFMAIAAGVVTLMIVTGYLMGPVVGHTAPKVFGNLFAHSVAWRPLWVAPLGVALACLMMQGVAWIVRSTASTSIIVLLWVMGIDRAVVFLPDIGIDLHQYLPLVNLSNAVSSTSLIVTKPWWWSLAVLACWAVAVWAVGVALLERRDA